jgi:hypothetical protein
MRVQKNENYAAQYIGHDKYCLDLLSGSLTVDSGKLKVLCSL